MKSDRIKIKEDVSKWNNRSACEDRRLTSLDSVGDNSCGYSEWGLKLFLIFGWFIKKSYNTLGMGQIIIL